MLCTREDRVSKEELLNTHAVLTLLQLPGIGPATVVHILAQEYEEHEYVPLLEAVSTNWRKLPIPTAQELQQAEDAADEILGNASQLHIDIIPYNDASFPPQLRHISDAPAVIYVKGNTAALSQTGVAVVGTRNPTDYGRDIARRFGTVFAEHGLVVVSGLALGCDTEAHEGCLAADGLTVAVMAHGLDHVHPAANKDLAERIVASGGCLVSEYPPGVLPQRGYFVQRDRLQSGLSAGVVIVETGIKGGAMHTAKFSRAQKRTLACFNHPSHLRGEKSEGNQQLIAEGAIPLQNKDDIYRFVSEIKQPQSERTPSKVGDDRAVQLGLFDTPRKRVVLFDLDQTLIASRSADGLRKARRWKEVYRLIPEMAPYAGIPELLNRLRQNGLVVGIVTSTPKSYCTRVLTHWRWDVDETVCYHDTREHKPHPAPIHECLKRLQSSPPAAIYVGDSVADIEASRRANVVSVAALWDSDEPELVREASPDYICETVDDLEAILLQLTKIR